MRVTIPSAKLVMLSHIVQFSPAIEDDLLADRNLDHMERMQVTDHRVDSRACEEFAARNVGILYRCCRYSRRDTVNALAIRFVMHQ